MPFPLVECNRYIVAGTTWEEYYVCFDGPGVRRLLEAGWFFNDGSVHRIEHLTDVLGMWRELIRVLRRGAPGDADRASLATQRLLLELSLARSSFAQARPSDGAIHEVLAHCQKHYLEPVDWHALARRHAVSYSHLRQRIRGITGMSPARYLTHIRCDAARHLLSDTELAVKQVAPRVGIADPYAFSRVFRKAVGVSPRAYRKQTALWA